MGRLVSLRDIREGLEYVSRTCECSLSEDLVRNPRIAFLNCVHALDALKNDEIIEVEKKISIAQIINYYMDVVNERLGRLNRLF